MQPSRCTFGIISHPDAGKTTITEKILLYGGAIQLAGTVKGRKAAIHAHSDWMALEKERGISVTTAVMQFLYAGRMFNLLDTPGHADFSEDTYRTLTAVDAALMVIDAVKGVEARTIKLMQVCRLRHTPIVSFVNKMDRAGKTPLELLDEIEAILKIHCAPVTWPIGQGKFLRGIYHLVTDQVILYQAGQGEALQTGTCITGARNPLLQQYVEPDILATFWDELELMQAAGASFDTAAFLAGQLTPVFFGSALQNFGVQELLDALAAYAPPAGPRASNLRMVEPLEPKFSAFVFKIQANMDPLHRDRVAFLRVCSGQYTPGMRLYHVRTKKELIVQKALTFMAGKREATEAAYPGDILGLHNHGNIRIGDTFTQGELLQFTGIPHFAPELFKIVRLTDPLKAKALHKGLGQLAEEGAVQVFRMVDTNRMLVGAVGVLQFEVVAYRLQHEYSVQCVYEEVAIATARWLSGSKVQLEALRNKYSQYLAYDLYENLVYMAPSMVNLQLSIERFPALQFAEIHEING
jgi:peptide chain release factor 3